MSPMATRLTRPLGKAMRRDLGCGESDSVRSTAWASEREPDDIVRGLVDDVRDSGGGADELECDNGK